MLSKLIDDFRDKIGNGVVLGPFSKSSDPAFIEIMGHSGFDFVVLDLEHGPNNTLSLQNLIRGAEVSGLLPIVRVMEGSPALIGQALDAGAGGIQVPNVSNKQDVERIIHGARFAPQGMRGVCRFVRAADYSAADRGAYFATSNTALVILQLEGREAVENIEEILSVPGVDIVFIGPYDLSQSLGVPGEVRNPKVTEAMKKIVGRCIQHRVLVGTFADTPEDARTWRDAGVRYLCYSVDVGLFTEKCRETVHGLKK